MATTIQHKRSTTASAVPISSDLTVGELAVNTADGLLFTKHSDNSIVPIVSSSDAASKLTAEVKNVSGGNLAKGTPVYINGATGNTFHVDAVRADSEGKMPASGILSQNLANNADGIMVISGFINGLNTSSFTAGDAVYVASTGGYTNIAPAGENNFIQKLGIVSKVDSDNGALLLQGAGRANAVPNLDSDQFFLGNSSNKAVATDFSTAAINAVASTYVDVSGDTLTGDLAFGDNVKAKFGASDDLQIYHDGSTSYIKDAGTGNLDISTNGSAIRLVQGNGNRLVTAGYGTAGVKLWYGSDDTEKLATTSSGVDITGIVVADGLTINDYSFPSSDGSANQVLTTDGVGNITFADAASGGASEDFAIAMAVALG